ncbi:MAG: septum site-determining protein MinD [Chloroflexi bacterium]|nr:septum site-determining protein MinD [Chloroflexota bacterium]MYD47059.1 septum site-determining protein MinD [Chloroflexota bacterium]
MSGKTIVMTSGKGGVGKTTATANVGVGLALRGKRVVVIDTDIGLRNLDVVMGLENRIVYDLIDVVEERCRVEQALIRDKHAGELYLIAAAQTRDKDCISSQQLIDLCRQLEADFDYVIVDCPAGIEQGFRNAIAAAREALVVTTPEVSAIRDADRVIGLLHASDIHSAKLIINRIKPEMVRQGDMLDASDVLDMLAVDAIGLIPADDRVITTTNNGTPVAHDVQSPSGREFVRIAARIDGEYTPMIDPVEEQSTSIMDKVRTLMGITRKASTHV